MIYFLSIALINYFSVGYGV